MIVTKRTFVKVFGPAFINIHTPSNLQCLQRYRNMAIKPNVIHPERLDPSLTTEQINTLPSSVQPPELSSSTSELLANLNHSHTHSYSTRLNKLMEENTMLK